MKKPNLLDSTYRDIQQFADASANRDQYVSKEELDQLFPDAGYRLPDYYSRVGVIEKPLRFGKEACWPKSVIGELKAIKILRKGFRLSLTKIKELAAVSDYELGRITNDALIIIDCFLDQTLDLYKLIPSLRTKNKFELSQPLWGIYFILLEEGKLKSEEEQVAFQERFDTKFCKSFTQILEKHLKEGAKRDVISKELDQQIQDAVKELYGE